MPKRLHRVIEVVKVIIIQRVYRYAMQDFIEWPVEGAGFTDGTGGVEVICLDSDLYMADMLIVI